MYKGCFIVMLTKLRMYITGDNFEITRHISSVLHGVIMSVIDTDYASILHNSNLNPFSTSLVKNGDEWCWTVATVGQEAYDKIFKVLADKSLGNQNVIDAKAAIPSESHHSIVPPGIGFFRLFKSAEGIR